MNDVLQMLRKLVEPVSISKPMRARELNRMPDQIRVVSILYHLILAILYGSPLDVWYSDPYWYVGTGLTIAGNSGALLVQDQPPVLPFFIAFIYRAFGFPNFGNYLWLWNVATMTILVFGTYRLTEYYFNLQTANIATLLIAFNWHIGWYGQMLLVDTTVVSFMFLSLSAHIKYLRHGQRRYLYLAGFLTSVTIWTKLVSIVLFLPVITFLLFRDIKNRIRIADFVLGFLFGQLLLIPITSLYTLPLVPILAQGGGRLGQLIASIREFKLLSLGNLYYFMLIPFSISFPLTLFFLIGLWELVKQKKYFFPIWSAYAIFLYSFLITPRIDQYAVHFTPLLILIASFGVTRFIEKINVNRRASMMFILVLVLCTNSAFPLPLLFGRNFPAPYLLSQRLAEFSRSHHNVDFVREAFSRI